MAIDLMAEVDANEKGMGGEGFVSLTRLIKSARRTGRAQETMTTSDFTYMADLTDRGVMTGYLDDTVPISYPALGYKRNTSDLVRGVSGSQTGRGRDYRIDAVKTIPTVAEKGEYLPIDVAEEWYNFATRKYGCQFDVSWEAWLADGRDLGLLQGYPATWGLSTRYTQQQVFTTAYAGSTATFFSVAHANLGTGALSEANLALGIAAIRTQATPAGNVSAYGGKLTLVVPPGLELTARQIVNSTLVVSGAGAARPELNMVAGAVNIVVDAFLPSIDTTQGTTAWYLFCDPRIRPAIRYGFLEGFEEPEIFVKAGEAQRLFGGNADPFDGTFLTDDIEFKLRFMFGADQVDYRGAYMSTGVA